MGTYLIVGAGAIGTVVAEQLVRAGHDVRLMSRSGTGPASPSVSLVTGDASNAATVNDQSRGVDAIFNCANPHYHRWPSDWPPIANAILAAAESNRCDLVTLGNLYAYGEPTRPMSPHDPLDAPYEKAQVRATMWRDAKRAHDQGRIRATEVRASDYIGPGSQSYASAVTPRVIAGKRCWLPGAMDVAHSWNYTSDVARTLIACAHDDRSWGRAWHAPANPSRTIHQLVDDIADAAGVARVRVSRIPTTALRVVGVVSPVVRELPTTLYQFNVPFVIDDSETREVLGIEPTAWTEVLTSTVASFRAGR